MARPGPDLLVLTYTPPDFANTIIYARFSPSGSPADYIGNISNVGGGASKAVELTGTSIYSLCASGSDACDNYIGQLQVGTIDNSSGCSEGGYADYSSFSTNMYKTVGYAITITNPNFYGNDVCGIWADWNMDGDLYDGSESITVSGGPEVFTATITPPANAIEGSTPLRIRIHYSDEEIVPCGNSFYGEVEDYTINVLPVPASPTFGITPAIKKYGDCPLNNLSPDYFTQTFTVQNLGPGPLTISNVSLTGGDVTQFILTDPHTYPVGLSGTSTIQFTVKFNPATIGPKATTLRIQSSAKTNHDVALSGTGIVYPPQNLSGVTTPANTNELDWDPPLPEGEVRYDNGVASGTYLVNEPSTATNYIDGDVSPVTTYFYGVTALYSGSQQSDISNVLSLTTLADNSVTWTGNVSTEWNNADNWDSGSIPDATIKVIIPSDPVSNRFPVINKSLLHLL